MGSGGEIIKAGAQASANHRSTPCLLSGAGLGDGSLLHGAKASKPRPGEPSGVHRTLSQPFFRLNRNLSTVSHATLQAQPFGAQLLC